MIGWTNPTHLVLLLGIALLLFGAKRLPEIGRSLGTGMREFKDSVSNVSEATKVDVHAELPPPAPADEHHLSDETALSVLEAVELERAERRETSNKSASANSLACAALSALFLTVEVICSIEEAVSSKLEACSSVRLLNSRLPREISSAPSCTSCEVLAKLVTTSIMD